MCDMALPPRGEGTSVFDGALVVGSVVLAFYTLAFPLVQALTVLYVPSSLWTIVTVKLPVAVAMVSMPLGVRRRGRGRSEDDLATAVADERRPRRAGVDHVERHSHRG